jgi:hypothetical protein
MYVWGGYYDVISNASDMAIFFNICAAEGVNIAWLGMDSDSLLLLANSPGGPQNAYQTFIAAAKARGIQTYIAIGGNLSNFTNPSTDESYITAILKYNVNNPSVAINGINWDIEGVSANQYVDYTTYLQTLKAITYNGQTIVSQGLMLSAYCDVWNTQISRTFIHQLNCVDINCFASGLTTGGDGAGMEGEAATAVSVCQSEGVNFAVGIDTASTGNPNYTVYSQGLNYLDTLETQVNNYYASNYTDYVGIFVNCYQNSILNWYKAAGLVK